MDSLQSDGDTTVRAEVFFWVSKMSSVFFFLSACLLECALLSLLPFPLAHCEKKFEIHPKLNQVVYLSKDTEISLACSIAATSAFHRPLSIKWYFFDIGRCIKQYSPCFHVHVPGKQIDGWMERGGKGGGEGADGERYTCVSVSSHNLPGFGWRYCCDMQLLKSDFPFPRENFFQSGSNLNCHEYPRSSKSIISQNSSGSFLPQDTPTVIIFVHFTSIPTCMVRDGLSGPAPNTMFEIEIVVFVWQ